MVHDVNKTWAPEAADKAREDGSVARVRRAAALLGLDVLIREMPASTRTAEEAAAACGTSVERIVKSLVFADAGSGGHVLLLVSGGHRVDPRIAEAGVGSPLARADARAVRAATGFAIGGVSPIGSLAPLPVFMDETLLGFDRVFAAAGSPNAVFAVDPRALARATGATVIRVA